MGLALIKAIASSKFLYVITGKIGPKISSFINGDSGDGLSTTVGYRSLSMWALAFPITTVP